MTRAASSPPSIAQPAPSPTDAQAALNALAARRRVLIEQREGRRSVDHEQVVVANAGSALRKRLDSEVQEIEDSMKAAHANLIAVTRQWSDARIWEIQPRINELIVQRDEAQREYEKHPGHAEGERLQRVRDALSDAQWELAGAKVAVQRVEALHF
jgi:hypothetical protein